MRRTGISRSIARGVDNHAVTPRDYSLFVQGFALGLSLLGTTCTTTKVATIVRYQKACDAGKGAGCADL